MKKVLIVPMYGMGDTLLITPAIEILKKNKLDYHITCLTFQKINYEVLKDNPDIDRLEFFPFLKKGFLASIPYIVKNIMLKFDIAINFYPSNRKAYNIFSFLTLSKERVGHKYLNYNFIELNWLKNRTIKENPSLHCVEENIKLLNFFGIDTDNIEIPPLRIYLSNEEITNGINFIQKISKNKIKIGIHTGSSSFKNHKFRRLPKERFIEVVNHFKEIDFFLFGTDEEREENHFILNNSIHKNVYLVENKSIREVAAIIKNLNIFLSNDSGLMHLAAATGIPVIAIFGPTNPTWVKPWKVKHKIINLNLPCSPCFVYSPKPLICNQKEKFKCLKNIDSKMVINAINELLE